MDSQDKLAVVVKVMGRPRIHVAVPLDLIFELVGLRKRLVVDLSHHCEFVPVCELVQPLVYPVICHCLSCPIYSKFLLYGMT